MTQLLIILFYWVILEHQQMADYYRSTIAKGLMQFDNGQHSDQFYDDMAWEGLANIVDANNRPNQIYTEA